MNWAVISDVHGNLPALEAVLADSGSEAGGFICLGDVVNYGPWSNECLELIVSLPGIVFLEGNHEALFLGKESVEDENPLVQQFYHAASAGFRCQELIQRLPLEHTMEGFLFTHTFGHMKIYPDTDFVPPQDCFVGHTHHAFDVIRHGHRVVNPGSVGQNRKHLDRACYAMFDSETREVDLRHIGYDVDRLLSEMSARHYPEPCLAYYRSKLPDAA